MPACARGFTLFDFLQSAAERYPERTYLFDAHRAISFREALDQANALAAAMVSRGLRPGDRILLVLHNRIEVPLILYAAAKVGVIFSLLSPQLKPERFRGIVRQCEPALLFLEESTAALRSEAASLPVVWMDGDPPRDEGGFKDLLAGEGTADRVPGGEHPALLVFTSGSTGAPRGVTLSHANIEFVTGAIQARLGYQAADRIGLLLPLSFDYGLYQVFYAALSGAGVFMARPESCGPELPGLLARFDISVLPVVPTLLATLLKVLRYRPVALPELRIVTNTGDHLPLAHIQQLRGLLPQVRVFPMYGLTECKRVSILLPEEVDAHPDSVGRALDGTEVWAEAPDGARLPPGEVGQLAVSGPHVSLGYWRDPAGTAERFRTLPDGCRVLLTGDFGSVDAGGFIHFRARSEYMIKHHGHRLSPVEVEEAVCHLPQVAAAGCIKDDIRDLLCLFVATVGPPPEAAAVLADLATRIERGKLPDKVIFLPDLPRTPNHKVDRGALRSLLATLS